MVAVIVLIILALLFGVGAVIKGLFWLGLIAVVLIAVGLYFAWRVIKGPQAD